MNKKFEETQKTTFNIHKTDSFMVTVCGWDSLDGKYHWNVYARIFDTHPLFDDPEKAMEVLPFAGGCTYDEMEIRIPARGIEYDWQKEIKILVLGSDYAHIWDDYDNHPSPKYGIPGQMRHDAEELVKALEKFSVIKEEALK